jgi:diguanylate cyclase (GGDEF)-like protein
VDWSRLPDVGAVALLTCAFVSVDRRGQTAESGIWLVGWLMIVFHFVAEIFDNYPGPVGDVAVFVSLCALAWAGALFTWATIPYREKVSSRWMLGFLMAVNAFYLSVVIFAPQSKSSLNIAAALTGLLPLSIAALSVRTLKSARRWTIVVFYCGLSAFLLLFQNRPGNGLDLAINAVFFTVYFACSVNFCLSYWRASAGAFITITGFFAWASVFLVGPLTIAYAPNLHLESEVWNLPKYIVALGMILLILEDQIEHNKYLALHDELTGLPNRRLFQDRLGSALERARRLGTQAALLLVDLDHFKNVNDTYGHHIGDLVLSRVGAVLSGRVRRSDTVARTGGDEFSIVLEGPTTREDAEHVCSSLVQLLGEALQVEEHSVVVGASVGLAIYPDDATTFESLCIAADLRMYCDKLESRQSSEANPLTQRPVSGPSAKDPGENGQTSFAASKLPRD